MTGGGLSPPLPSSVEPIGIPTRLTDETEPIPVGDEADAAGPAKELPAVAAQVPDADPAVPPPSNTALEPDVPPVDIPVPEDVPVIELPMPVGAPADEAPRPKDACGDEPPMPPHVVGDVPNVVGLTPGVASPEAPKGTLAGGSAKPGPIPSGEVMPTGDWPGAPVPIWAKAGPQPKSMVVIATMNERFMSVLLTSCWRSACPDCGDSALGIALPRRAAQCNKTQSLDFATLRPPGRPACLWDGASPSRRTHANEPEQKVIASPKMT
jgi:hypothetical protein